GADGQLRTVTDECRSGRRELFDGDLLTGGLPSEGRAQRASTCAGASPDPVVAASARSPLVRDCSSASRAAQPLQAAAWPSPSARTPASIIRSRDRSAVIFSNS